MLKPPNFYDKDKMEYVRVALAIETLAFHNKNYLWTGDNLSISEEIQSLLLEALKKDGEEKARRGSQINGQGTAET